MSIGIKPIHDAVCAVINNTNPSALDLLQSSEIYCQDITVDLVQKVSTCTNLPAASNNTGRFIYLEDKKCYVYSNGAEWTSNPSSIQTSVNGAWAWGSNSCGQLGDNTIVSKSSPVSVVGGFTDWCQISAGQNHSVGLRTNNTIWAWGCNTYGTLGNNSTTNSCSPVSVVGGFTDWCQVSTQGEFTVGLRANGTIWTWGRNNFGQLGDGTAVDKSSPVSVVGGFNDWIHINAGPTQGLGIRANGTAWAWGNNTSGKLGDGTVVSTSSPVSVIGGFTDWCQLAGANNHSIGLRSNGTVWAWGLNVNGELGDGTLVGKSSPVSVVGGFTDWCQVSASYGHNAAVRLNGTLWTWGLNSYGVLGDGTIVGKSSPVSVVGGFLDWCQVDTGQRHDVAIRTNGTAWAWGLNIQGNLGDNTTVNKSSPVSVVSEFTNWRQVSAGRCHTLGIVCQQGF